MRKLWHIVLNSRSWIFSLWVLSLFQTLILKLQISQDLESSYLTEKTFLGDHTLIRLYQAEVWNRPNAFLFYHPLFTFIVKVVFTKVLKMQMYKNAYNCYSISLKTIIHFFLLVQFYQFFSQLCWKNCGVIDIEEHTTLLIHT